MPLFPFLLLGTSLAGPPTLDEDRVCASKERVALAPSLQRRFRGGSAKACPSVVPAATVAAFMKAFAVRERELSDDQYADQLVRHADARWLVIGSPSDHQVFDGEEKAWVDVSPFVPAPASPAEEAYLAGYTALRGKRYDTARTKLDACLELEPEHAGCHWELGWVDWVAEEWAAAAEHWEAVERLDPDHPEVGTWLPKARRKANSD